MRFAGIGNVPISPISGSETRTLNSATATDAILKTCSQSHAIGGDCNVRDFRQAAVPFLNGMVSLTEGNKTEAAERFRDAKDHLIQVQPPPHMDIASPSAS